MLKVLICAGDAEASKALYQRVYSLLTEMKARGELSYSNDPLALKRTILEKGAQYDLYVLDSRGAGCVELPHAVRKTNLIPSILFLGGRDENLETLIKLRPSFIFRSERIDDKALKEALRWCVNEQIRLRTYFNVKNKDVQMRIPFDAISYFESQQRIVTLHTAKQAIDFYAKLTDVHLNLPNDKFIRCHQSYIVNMSKVRQLDKGSRRFVMQSGTIIDISKSQYKTVVDAYEQFAAEN